MRRKVLIVTTVSGFLYQFEKNAVEIWKEKGASLHYASNFQIKAYEFEAEFFEKNEIVCHPLTIEKSPYRIGRNMQALKELIRIIREEKIDIVHCHNPMGGVLGRLAAHLSGREVHVIYTAHGFHFYKGAPLKNWLLYYPAEKFLAKCTNTLITINQEDKNIAETFHLKKNGQLAAIPGVGVDLKKYCPKQEQREAAREVLGVGSRELCLMTAALLDKNKNHRVIFKLLEQWRKEKDFPKLKYVICGAGPYESKLKREVKRRGLDGIVCFLGFRRDLPFLLQGVDLFLFPSKREGLGMAALEAMACAVPVAAAENRGTREYVRHGENGFLCDPGKTEGFRAAIEEIERKAKQGNELSAMKEAAVRTASAFSAEQSKSKMEMIYKSIGKGSKEHESKESQCDHECLQSKAVFPAGDGGQIYFGTE